MRDYGKVFSRIWESADFRALSEDGRTLVLYLLTCPHGTIAGTFRVPDGYACEDLQWSAERVAEGFRDLSAKGFATRCEITKWVWVTKFLEWNPPENPNQKTAARKVVAGVPDSCGWKQAFMRVCGHLIGFEKPAEQEPLANPLPTVPQPVAVAVAVAEEPPLPPEGAGRSSQPDPQGFPEFWAAWPAGDRKQDRKKCAAKWRRSNLSRETAVIVAHVEASKATRKWRDGFDPAPLTYLNGERWRDGPPAEVSELAFAGADV